MDLPDLIPDIKKRVPDFEPVAVSQDYPDEVSIKVVPPVFKGVCLALHGLLASPVMMFFARDERKAAGVFVVSCVFLQAKKSRWITVSMDIPQEDPGFESLANSMHSAALFEREMREMFGIEPRGNPDRRRLRLHDEVWPQGNYPLRKDFAGVQGSTVSAYIFDRVEGEGVFEVPVGPVHAGIIGPGHFRFSVAGEPIINLEARLGFTHRGVEKLFEGRLPHEAMVLAERVSGDSSVAHSLAFTHAVEKIMGVAPSRQAASIRAICLELERLYNHATDMGGIAVDVGFSFPSAYASIVKETILRLNEKVFGHRYLKGVNAVGGVLAAVASDARTALAKEVKNIRRDLAELAKMLYGSTSFMDRVDTTGILRKKTADDIGVVGLAGRASGIALDLRKIFPGAYKDTQVAIAVESAGDVLARLRVRIAECKESCRLIEFFCGKLSGSGPLQAGAPAKAGIAIGCAEGWRGPVLYWVKTDAAGRIERCKIVDPSFHNWEGLTFAVLGNIIPDFPLCNKSFDLSYAGNDL